MSRQQPASPNKLYAIMVLLAVLCVSPSALAACTSPAGNAGDIIYSSTSSLMAYCNNFSWVNMGAPTAGTGGAAAGANSQVQYNNTGALAGDSSFTYASPGLLTLGKAGTLGSLTFGNATSGLLTIQPVTGTLGTVTLSLPAATDTLVGRATTDTLTNKSIAGSEINSSTVGVTYGGTGLSNPSAGALLIGNGSSNVATLADVATGSVLISGGVGSNPSYSSAPTISGANISSLNASNLSSGTALTARLGSGTANSSTFLRGDSTWQTISIPTYLSSCRICVLECVSYTTWHVSYMQWYRLGVHKLFQQQFTSGCCRYLYQF